MRFRRDWEGTDLRDKSVLAGLQGTDDTKNPARSFQEERKTVKYAENDGKSEKMPGINEKIH